MPRRIQSGFTLIELVVVIAILGILAAVALPRFTDLQTQARAAKANALMGAVRAAAANAKASAVVAGASCNGAGSVTMEGRAISLIHCYPQAVDESGTPTVWGILSAANIDAATVNNLEGVVMDYTDAGTAAAKTVKIQVAGANSLAGCAVTYTAPAAANGQPTFAVATSGC